MSLGLRVRPGDKTAIIIVEGSHVSATKGRRVQSKMKVMLLAFFDSEGTVHHENAPDGQTINKEFYVEVLWCLCESLRWKRLEKWWDGDWILHRDNVPAHTSHLVLQF